MRRRAYLTGSAAAIALVAGCLGGGDNDDESNNDAADESGNSEASRTELAEQVVTGYFQNLDDGSSVNEYRRSLDDSDSLWVLFEEDVRNGPAGIADVDAETRDESEEAVTVVADIDWSGTDERDEFVAEVANFDENPQIVALQPTSGDFPDADIQDVELVGIDDGNLSNTQVEFLIEGELRDGRLQPIVNGTLADETLRPADFRDGRGTVQVNGISLNGGEVPFDAREIHSVALQPNGTLDGTENVSVELMVPSMQGSVYAEDVSLDATLDMTIVDVSVDQATTTSYIPVEVTLEMTNTGQISVGGTLYIDVLPQSEFELDPGESITATGVVQSSDGNVDTRATAFVGNTIAASERVQAELQPDPSIEKLELEVVENEYSGTEVERLLLEIENTGEAPLPEDTIVINFNGDEHPPLGFDTIASGERVTYDLDDVVLGLPEETNTITVEIIQDGEVLASEQETDSI